MHGEHVLAAPLDPGLRSQPQRGVSSATRPWTRPASNTRAQPAPWARCGRQRNEELHIGIHCGIKEMNQPCLIQLPAISLIPQAHHVVHPQQLHRLR